MVIHYSAPNGNVACGRTGSSLNSSGDAAQVSCKLCLRSVEKAVSEPGIHLGGKGLADLRDLDVFITSIKGGLVGERG